MRLDADCLILAERLRVEERLILAACDAAGIVARLIQPDDFSRLLTDAMRSPVWDGAPETATVFNRLPATRNSATLATFAHQAGLKIINPPELTWLLADRIQMLARLQSSDVAVRAFSIGWGADATLEAIEAVGYPAQLSVAETTTPAMTILDREAAEAVIEHRMVLGGDRLFIVQPDVAANQRRQIHLIGDLTVGLENRTKALVEGDLQLASWLRDALGPGVYSAEITGEERPEVLAVRQLGRFRDQKHPEQIAAMMSTLAVNALEFSQ